MSKILVSLIFMAIAITGQAQITEAPENPPPDQRFKTDILLILAHPDDETAIGSFLARAVFDDRRRIAAVYLNGGNGGGNSIGNEQSLAMASIREIEVRQALARFNISNVWMLDGKDTPGQDLFKSLHNVMHGPALEKIIRLIRLTRPEVILTWMPIIVAGENHGDHQAAGVLATEAFDLAGDPLVFPAQVTVPRDRLDIDNFQEGLLPWQPKKLYYFSDREQPLSGPGPAFDLTDVSPSKNIPYYQLAAELHTPHLVQGEVAMAGIEALDTKDFSELINWVSKFRLIYGKSVVPCKADGPLFAGIESGPVQFHPAVGYVPEKGNGLYLRPGGIFAFYKAFWRAHAIAHLADLVKPEIMVAAGDYLHLPLLLQNFTDTNVELDLDCDLPPGWTIYSGRALYRLKAGEIYPAQTMIRTADLMTEEPVNLKWILRQAGKEIESFSISVHLREWTLPQ